MSTESDRALAHATMRIIGGLLPSPFTPLGEYEVAEIILAAFAKRDATTEKQMTDAEDICGAYSDTGVNGGRGCLQPRGHTGNHGDVTVKENLW